MSKYCYTDNFEMRCFKTGAMLLLRGNPIKLIDDKIYRKVIKGDLFYCPICNQLQLCGAREVYYSPENILEAVADHYQIINTGYNEVVGDIKLFRTIEMLEFHNKWYPETIVTWEDL